jgi:hypothetical protein
MIRAQARDAESPGGVQESVAPIHRLPLVSVTLSNRLSPVSREFAAPACYADGGVPMPLIPGPASVKPTSWAAGVPVMVSVEAYWPRTSDPW